MSKTYNNLNICPLVYLAKNNKISLSMNIGILSHSTRREGHIVSLTSLH